MSLQELPKEQAREQFDYWTNKLGLKHTFEFDEVYDLLMERRMFREQAKALEEHIKNIPQGLGADPFPLVHTFSDGLYIRQLTVPPKTLTVTKTHKQEHVFFLQKGTISVLTPEGIRKYTAPYMGITKVGTKRIIYHHDEVIFTTIHSSNKKTVEEVEEQVIAKDFDKETKDFIDVVAKEEICLSSVQL